MTDIPDVSWEVAWDQDFEENINSLKSSGSFGKYKKQIISVIERPVREGKYKAGNYKGLKTVHVSGGDQDVICFELTPGINAQSELDKLEEIYFHHIAHWDDYDSALNSRKPAGGGYQFEIQIPYLGGPYDPERVKSDVYDMAKSLESCHVESQEWADDCIRLSGQIESDERDKLDNILPDGPAINFTPHSPF